MSENTAHGCSTSIRSHAGLVRTARGMSTRGFTLIEVLLGVIVLGLGLLGLAAIFPAVVVQQRSASDAVQGETVVEGVQSTLRGSGLFNARSQRGQQGDDVPGAFRAMLNVIGVPNAEVFSPDGAWVGPILGQASPRLRLQTSDGGSPDAGRIGDMEMTLFNTLANASGSVFPPYDLRFSLRDRYVPVLTPPEADIQNTAQWRDHLRSLDAPRTDPRYVWDFMIRRVGVPGTPRTSDRLQVAVFVRRIDPGIRLQGQERSVGDALRSGRVLPVAATAQGVATLDGVGDGASGLEPTYSLIVPFEAQPVADRRGPDSVEWFEQLSTPAALTRQLAQVGQRFVGPTGAVHTVVEVERTSGGTLVRVLPAYRDVDQASNEYALWGVPQLPASVSVFEVAPPPLLAQ